MKITSYFLFLACIAASLSSCKGQTSPPGDSKTAGISDSTYVFKRGSYDGIGKWYMDREIAHVMGFQGMEWLERPEREKEENTSRLIKNMNLKPTDDIADIGAGSGYHVFKMSSLVNNGTMYAVDLQPEMLTAINQKKESLQIENIELILGDEQSTYLPENSVDKILMVDVYHEFSFPVEMIHSMKKALRKNGEIYLIEYRTEDPNIPIKTIHKMSEAQAVKEFKANGFKLKENITNLPWQHCMIFVKE
jgi:protein-L-isoaspartate O-methyltransferase